MASRQQRTLLQPPARDRPAIVAGPREAAALPAALEQARRARRHRLLHGCLALDPCGSHAVVIVDCTICNARLLAMHHVLTTRASGCNTPTTACLCGASQV